MAYARRKTARDLHTFSFLLSPEVPLSAICSGDSSTGLLPRLSGVFEQEVEGLLALNVVGYAAQSAVLFEFHVNRRHWLALLACDPLHLAIHFVLRGVDR